MLSEETEKYIAMLHAPSVDANGFYRCRLLIKDLQREIEIRKHTLPVQETTEKKISGK